MRILYATDGSEGSLAAARLLSALPLELDTTITVLAVAEGANAGATEQALSATLEALGHGTATFRTKTRTGKPAEQILREVDETNPDLVVLGSRGKGAVARFFLGSVAERVARHAAGPVLVARGETSAVRKVVLGIDGSAGASHAAEWLRRFPLPSDCEVRLVTSLPFLNPTATAAGKIPGLADDLKAIQLGERQEAEQRLEKVYSEFREAGITSAAEFRQQQSALGLVEAAEQNGAALVVVGRQGMSRVERFIMGSVSEHVLRHAPCSVLIIPQGQPAK